MKKTILTFLLVSPFMLFAQTVKELKVQNADKVKVDHKNVVAIDLQSVSEIAPGSSDVDIKNKKAKNYTYVELGRTYYDLQTNSSPGRRIVLHSDGTVSAVWTASPDAGTGYPNRGSGYNYSDGTNWMTGRDNKIESTGRSGWPSIMLMEDGSETIIAHESSTGGFLMSKNTSKGSTSFSTGSAILDDKTELNVNRVPIWNRSAASNGKIHTISNYWASTASNVPVVTRNGVASPTTYSRWDVATNSSEVEHMMLPGYDSSLYTNGGGDSYAIDVRDSIVAILLGGLGDPVSLWKSTDNGSTWTYTDIDKLPFKGPRRDAELILSGDTMSTNDGSVDVMIDASGKVHAFWGLGRILGGTDDAGDSTFFFFPGQSSLRHWKEGDSEDRPAGAIIDMEGDQALTINSETFSALDANGNIPNNLLSASRTGATSLVTMPSASSDADGNLFVVYSAPVEGALHFLNANFRDIHISYSTDGGETWNGPQNITQDRTEECNFPCAAKMANNFLHVMWQQDATPGTALQNHSASAGTHPNDVNRMHYAAVPVTDILNNVIGQNLIGVDEIGKSAEVFVVSQNQPNPFNGTAEAVIYLRSGSKVSLTVTDVLGNVVNQGSLGMLGAGNHNITLDANGLTSGMYFYTLSTRDHRVTKKMQVK
ncbi:T9SS type A sorting domain-containing protein [Bacteroidia bacterium]|nr:T9SS type A sorting domain-containing protein [Bacteroidia bacterium]